MQIKKYITLDTYIYHQLPPVCLDVFYTIFSRPLCYLLQIRMLFAVLLLNVQYARCFKIYDAFTEFKTICIASFCILKILRLLLQILTVAH
jgi:hypothetical protein